ncbi:hypothetical protein V1517DRAFT_261703 [Lipomyces orientalis]|uniref:Uncharacterized protein n=1 Tax=Lipomyces orientalis TaxID=1233043 RepID=A0ACC3TL98_9ASCO
MKLKLRLPSSASQVITLSDDAVVSDLLMEVRLLDELKDATELQFKSGFPPKPLDLSNNSAKLMELGVRSGDQLIVSAASVAVELPDEVRKLAAGLGESLPRNSPAPAQPTSAPPSTPTQQKKDDVTRPPEVPCGPDNVVVLRVMDDDNSCLFRAIGYALLRNLDTMHELRSLVAAAIWEDPIEYSDVVLGKPREEYCKWISKSNSWGGAIEIAVLAKHFDITICSIDVATGRVDSFNPDRPTFIILVYSGIHYDTVALAPEGVDGMYEFDQTVFDNDAAGQQVLTAADDLAALLRRKHYFTDTAGFSIKCEVCGSVFRGERQAQSHSESTGHAQFQEIN